MSIIYALVGYGDVIFSEYTNHSGNFPLIANQLLKKTSNNQKIYDKHDDNEV
jgi:hypothetical protein